MDTEMEPHLSQQRAKRNADRRDRGTGEEAEQRGGSQSPGRAAGTAEMGAAPKASVAEGWVWSVNQGPGSLGDSQVGGSFESKMGEEK